MINATMNIDPEAYETALYAVSTGSRRKAIAIKVSIVGEKALQWNVVAQNLVTRGANTVLKTRYHHDYQPEQEICYRGKWYIIKNLDSHSLDIAPQVMGIRRNPPREYYLGLIETAQ